MDNEIKCNCQNCNEHIVFPAEMTGQTIECPHCKLETRLYTPQVASPPRDGTSLSGNFIPLLIALFLLAIILIWVYHAQHVGSQQKSNISEIKGAFGWNLGDVLPGNLATKTNTDKYSSQITYDFQPPANLGIGDDTGAFGIAFLVLTEDRRIAQIQILVNETEHLDFHTVERTFEQKYGTPDVLNGSDGTTMYKFQINGRTVELLNERGSGLRRISLSYKDDVLSDVAFQQEQARITHVREEMQTNLMKNL